MHEKQFNIVCEVLNLYLARLRSMAKLSHTEWRLVHSTGTYIGSDDDAENRWIECKNGYVPQNERVVCLWAKSPISK